MASAFQAQEADLSQEQAEDIVIAARLQAKQNIDEGFFTDQHLDILRTQEFRAFGPARTAKALSAAEGEKSLSGLPQDVRRPCVQIMWDIFRCCPLQHSSPVVGDMSPAAVAAAAAAKDRTRKELFFRAVALLDLYYLRLPGAIDLEEVPGICAVIVVLVQKYEHNYRPNTSWEDKLEGIFAERLGISVERSRAAGELELEFLTAVDWQVDVPTVETYANVFFQRLDCATEGKYKDSIEWVKQLGMNIFAPQVALHCSPHTSPSSRTAALCLLCHGLAAAKLLPIDKLVPSTATSAEREEVQMVLRRFWKADCDGQAQLPKLHRNMLIECLQLATGASLEELGEATMAFGAFVAGQRGKANE